jgi:hypothetical protein
VCAQVAIPHDVVNRLRISASRSYTYPQFTEEYAAVIGDDGAVSYATLDRQESGVGGGTFNHTGTVKLLLHTHPMNDGVKPSVTDIHTAIAIGAPNCVVTRSEIWCALPDGTVEQEKN